jgi:metal-responsive CopG/Arc/MetJ family transcriptional regulator
MRILVDIEELDLALLDRLATQAKRSRAALIREAIADFLRHKRAPPENDGFGLWGKGKVDGLAYQRKMRAEW